MSAYLIFDSDGYCIAKQANTDCTIMQDTPVVVESLTTYPGMDWIHVDSAIRSMTTDESRLRRRKLKPLALQDAEISYEYFLSLLALPITADSETIMTKLLIMKAMDEHITFNGVLLEPSEISSLIQGLMHDIEVNGGSYKDL